MFGISAKTKLKLINFYPPFLGAGIRVKEVSDDYRRVDVQMKMRWWNKNLFGTHFGGSLFAMTDPFYVFILMMNLGKDYIVWDKSAKIEFVSPGKGTMSCRFELSQDQLDEIKQKTDANGKFTPMLSVDVLDAKMKLVARVDKELYIRKR